MNNINQIKEKLVNLQVRKDTRDQWIEAATNSNSFKQQLLRETELPGNDKKYSVSNCSTTNTNLKNKKIVFLGSSVTYGAGSFAESFVDFLEKKDQIIAYKEAVSGTTLVDINTDNPGDSYISRLKKFIHEKKVSSVDAFVLQLSTNDTRPGAGDLGKISSNNEFDTLTIIGAIEYILNLVKNTWNCPILIYSNPLFDNSKYAEMVRSTQRLQKKWNFDFLNMWSDPNFNYSSKQKDLFMSDDVHPTRAGYELNWLPAFENHLDLIIRGE